MLHTPMATRGMVSAPHHLAAQAGISVLRDGGNAIEAAIATASTLGVVYPHLSGLGGDGFWLIDEPGRTTISIDACGAAAQAAKAEDYRARGLTAVPLNGPLSACTVPGVVSGWQAALEISTRWGGQLPLSRLFEEAIHYARKGFAATESQVSSTALRIDTLMTRRDFTDLFLTGGKIPRVGQMVTLPGIATLLEQLAANGLDDFYRGTVGHHLGAELHKLDSPLRSSDLARHRSVRRRPLSVTTNEATVYNLPPPSQGLAALMILGLFNRLDVAEADGFAHIHGLVEAAKQAFIVRNAHVTDPAYMTIHSTTYLSEPLLDRLAETIAPRRALPWRRDSLEGNSVWFGVVDREGHSVSCVQSLGEAFGSGVAVGDFGLLWHNRGSSFSLDENGQNLLAAGRKPFHTLCPALARFRDGRTMVFGSTGGDAQPQIQAILFTRYARFRQALQQAITAPRWCLLGGQGQAEVYLEDRFPEDLRAALREAGHHVSVGEAFDSMMGFAGAIVRHPDSWLEGAADPRSDGSVTAF